MLLAANVVGGYFYFTFRALQIKHEMRALLSTLPDDELEIITLSTAAFNRVKVDVHEIKVDGKMYDIARIESAGDTLHVYCVHDEAEDNLLAFLDSVLLRLQNDSTQPPASVFAFAVLQYLPAEFSFQFLPHQQGSPGLTPYLQKAFFVMLPIDAPPPRV